MRHILRHFYVYLYSKNVLEYAQIARNEMESEIPYIEVCSISKYLLRKSFTKFHLFAQYK